MQQPAQVGDEPVVLVGRVHRLDGADQELVEVRPGHPVQHQLVQAAQPSRAEVLVAVGVYLPAPAVRAAIVLAVALAVALWLAQGLGELFTGMATDPESGPLLALLAISFWPVVPISTAPMPAKEA